MADGTCPFGAPDLGSRLKKPRGVNAPTYDCGSRGQLTMREMVRISGLARATLLDRVARGTPPEQLLAPRFADHPNALRYDCGPAGVLTVRQICALTGCGHSAIQKRIARGDRLEQLVRPMSTPKAPGPTRASLRTAVKLARAFPDRLPSAAEIRAVVPMSASSAARFRSALRAVLEGL